MRHHNDEPVPCDFLQNIHHLNARLRVKRAGGFICQHNVRIVDKRSCDCHPLHLSSGKL